MKGNRTQSPASIRGFAWTALLAACALVAAPRAADAEIHVKTLEDGTQLVYNETPVQRARRHSGRLQPPPTADLGRMIRHHAFKQGLSPRLVQAVIQVESGYNPKALSSKGAMGLMQLMPGTASILGVRDPWNSDQNIWGGARYLREQLERFGQLELALAAYNAGPTAVARHGGIPPYAETQRYVEKVLGLYHKSPPSLVQDHARQEAKRRARTRDTQERARKAAAPQGSEVFVTRDKNNRIIFTTRPPNSR
ncbi:MAG: lytic transglycosylase domain-containing protein [Acidobacteriota bacterium]